MDGYAYRKLSCQLINKCQVTLRSAVWHIDSNVTKAVVWSESGLIHSHSFLQFNSLSDATGAAFTQCIREDR